MNNKKGFSMVEMLVTMAIFAILSVMLLNSLLLNVRLSTKINIRARVRSDLNEIATQIERDIRNAKEILACGSSICTMNVNNKTVSWLLNTTEHRVIRTTDGVADYFSSPNLYFVNNGLLFNQSTIEADEKGKLRYANIVVTLFTESNAETLGCESAGVNKLCSNAEPSDIQWAEDQVRQFSVSTRNYMID